MGESFSNSSDYQSSLQDATGVIAHDYGAWLQERNNQQNNQKASQQPNQPISQNLSNLGLGGLEFGGGKLPHCIVFPETTTQLAAVMSHCAAQGWRVLPCGNGTKLDWGGVVHHCDVLISTARLNQIVEHCVGDLTVTAAAGVRFADLQQTLGTARQFWAIDPVYGTEATIGGILATADTNALRQRFNSVRDMVLGIEFVRADGAISHGGGRVVKNVAGYDLMKLLTGSYGTLGIITQATLRLYPVLGSAKTLLLTGKWQNLAELRRLVARSGLSPVVTALVNSQILALWQGSGFDHSAAPAGMIVQFAGLATSVTQQQEQLAELAKAQDLTAVPLHYDNQASLTEYLHQVIWQPDQSQDNLAHGIWCKVGMLPEQIGLVMQQWETLFGSDGYRALVNSGSGLGTLYIQGDFVANQDLATMTKLLLQARAQTTAAEGFLTILRAPIACKQGVEPWGYGDSMAMMHQIRQKFDPQGLLSYGRLFAETKA
jgi:glycolate oxidase FAD binding subunit